MTKDDVETGIRLFQGLRDQALAVQAYCEKLRADNSDNEDCNHYFEMAGRQAGGMVTDAEEAMRQLGYIKVPKEGDGYG
jgi:hypothetical protein